MKAKRPMSSNKIAVIITTGRNPVYWKNAYCLSSANVMVDVFKQA